MKRASNHRQKGFSLIELLVAFSIMALSLGFIYKAMGSGARNAGELASHQQVTMLAESILATRDAVTDQGWQEVGRFAPYDWTVSSQPFLPTANALSPSLNSNNPTAVPLHQIQLTIVWQDGSVQRQFETKTLLPQRKLFPGESLK